MEDRRKIIKGGGTEWESDSERLLLFADIMGFKEKVRTSSHAELVNEFRGFIGKLTNYIAPFENGDHLRLTMFSDSIIMATDSCTSNNFNIITKAAAVLMSLCDEYGYPLNGCISCGYLAFDEQIPRIKDKDPNMPLFVGKSAVDAYLLNADLFCYGIVLHHSAEKILKQTHNKCRSEYSYIPIPLKSGGYARHYYLSWFNVITNINKAAIPKKKIITGLEEMETMNLPRQRAYIYNTIDILNQLP